MGGSFTSKLPRRAQTSWCGGYLNPLPTRQLKHIEWLKQIFSGIKPEATTPEEVYKKLRRIFAEAPEDLRRSASAAQNDIETFRIALEVEEKSI